MLHLRVQLQTTKKGSMTFSEYFANMKSFVDALALGGYNVENDELVILTCLPSDYDATVTAILSLLAEEALLEAEVIEAEPVVLLVYAGI
ncbi:hypothetical protein PanWU01x14_006740 [Parasponia andersonii]|uniref:Uncharacterized protein n=1 Tax=Parasponia andersonii TaxID=3476 RepID=A0A2P5E3W1_PARAD|nr:hypothetical protein PanWU01x14_006740 [Parasponia andersonii]